MPFGCFVDIYQQDGKPVRMHYRGLDPSTLAAAKWIGIMEETAQQFRKEGEVATGETYPRAAAAPPKS